MLAVAEIKKQGWWNWNLTCIHSTYIYYSPDEKTLDKKKDDYSVTTLNSTIKRCKINNPVSSFITTKGYNIFVTNKVHSNKFPINTDLVFSKIDINTNNAWEWI